MWERRAPAQVTTLPTQASICVYQRLFAVKILQCARSYPARQKSQQQPPVQSITAACSGSAPPAPFFGPRISSSNSSIGNDISIISFQSLL